MQYSANEKIGHKTMKEKAAKYLLYRLGNTVIKCESEYYIKRSKGSWLKSDLYIETDTSNIIVEVKTSSKRQGLLQLLYQGRSIKTDKEIILILACNGIGKLQLRNFAQGIDDEELKRFRCMIFDKEFNCIEGINDLCKYKIKTNIA